MGRRLEMPGVDGDPEWLQVAEGAVTYGGRTEAGDVEDVGGG